MSDLNQDAARLMRAGPTAFRPDASDRDRVLRSLSAALGESALLDGTGQAGGADGRAAFRLTVKSWLVGGLAVVALGTGVVVAPHLWTRVTSHREPSRVAAATPAVDTVATARAGESNDVVASPEQATGGALPTTPRGSPRGAHPAPDSLPEEVRMLSRAEHQMNDGFAGDALKTLAEHERRFPNGSLAEERMAARVQALCALDRTTEAKSDLMRLMHAYPRSPQLERARKICGIDTGSPP